MLFGGGKWPTSGSAGPSIPSSVVSGARGWRDPAMRRAMRIPVPPVLRRGVTAPRMHTQLRVFGGITGRVERPPLKYRLTRGPTERRIQLTSGSMVLTPAQAVIESLRKLKPQDRHIIAGVVKTKFARGG